MKTIESVEDIIPYMELKMLLQKAERIDWNNYDSNELKELTNKLMTLSKNKTNSKKTVKQYEDELTKLMLKLFDTNVNSLDVIQFYEPSLTVHPKL